MSPASAKVVGSINERQASWNFCLELKVDLLIRAVARGTRLDIAPVFYDSITHRRLRLIADRPTPFETDGLPDCIAAPSDRPKKWFYK